MRRRVYWPLVVVLALIGGVGGFIALFVNSASAHPVIASTGVTTASGQTKSATLNILLFGHVVYTHASFDPASYERELMFWDAGATAVAVLCGAATGALGGYWIDRVRRALRSDHQL
jgi:hypothetical protein